LPRTGSNPGVPLTLGLSLITAGAIVLLVRRRTIS
jgi:LPXTG-motif cell wall-anchored protein